MIKKLCIISSYYPSQTDPYYAFVGTLVEQFADSGIECHVITPVSNMEKKHRGNTRVESTKKGSKIWVYCPSYTVYPSRNILGFQTYRFTAHSKRKALKRVFDKYVGTCDAIYSHFVDSAIYAAWLSKKTGIPAFAAIGESDLTKKALSYSLFKEDLYNYIRAVVAVSSELKREALLLEVFSKDTPIEVFPNGIDSVLFKPLNKAECREKLGIDEEDFVISFVGGFIKRKGFDRLQEAVSRHPKWKCILIGAGEVPIVLPKSQVVYSGRIPHEQIPNYICASDVFALPTQAEGCCNAIIEAMGCGLPIVSSNRSFNNDVLNDTNSVLIDPDSVDACEEALRRIEDDESLRTLLVNGALQQARKLSITNRAAGIVGFMEKHYENNY